MKTPTATEHETGELRLDSVELQESNVKTSLTSCERFVGRGTDTIRLLPGRACCEM